MDCRIWIEAAKTVLETAPCLEKEFMVHGFTRGAQLLREAIRKSRVALKVAQLLSKHGYECPNNVDELINIAGFFLAEGKDESIEDIGRAWATGRINPPKLNMGP